MPLEPTDRLLSELVDWLRIPSISSGGGDPADLERAAGWACERIEAAGGSAQVVATAGNPLAVGELRSRREDAPTVLIYGHYDVQSPDPVAAWTSPPFDPQVRDGRLYARGASDDKGNFLPLLHVACELARSGELPVHVRVLLEGEEEIGGHHVLDWIAADERGADVAVVFDSGMLDDETPAITLGVRGIVQLGVDVRTARRDLHSGSYGGAVPNAIHVLAQMLAAVLPGPDGLLRAELREGIEPPSEAEQQAWKALPDPGVEIASVGGRLIDEDAARNYFRHNWADASLDVNGLAGGDADQVRTIIPATASAKLSMRLAAGQRPERAAQVLERLLREAAHPAAEVEITLHGSGEPAAFDPTSPALQIAASSLERAVGRAPALIRVGGSIAALAAFGARGIPCLLSGFALPTDDIHAPDESFQLTSLALGEKAARELYVGFAKL